MIMFDRSFLFQLASTRIYSTATMTTCRGTAASVTIITMRLICILEESLHTVRTTLEAVAVANVIPVQRSPIPMDPTTVPF